MIDASSPLSSDSIFSEPTPLTGRPRKSAPPTKCKPVSRDRAAAHASSIHYNNTTIVGLHKLNVCIYTCGRTPVMQTEFLMGVRANNDIRNVQLRHCCPRPADCRANLPCVNTHDSAIRVLLLLGYIYNIIV